MTKIVRYILLGVFSLVILLVAMASCNPAPVSNQAPATTAPVTTTVITPTTQAPPTTTKVRSTNIELG